MELAGCLSRPTESRFLFRSLRDAIASKKSSMIGASGQRWTTNNTIPDVAGPGPIEKRVAIISHHCRHAIGRLVSAYLATLVFLPVMAAFENRESDEIKQE